MHNGTKRRRVVAVDVAAVMWECEKWELGAGEKFIFEARGPEWSDWVLAGLIGVDSR